MQVLAPNDVQFALTPEDKEEVVINTTSPLSEAVCIDTPAFVGVAISFVMILVSLICSAFYHLSSAQSPLSKTNVSPWTDKSVRSKKKEG